MARIPRRDRMTCRVSETDRRHVTVELGVLLHKLVVLQLLVTVGLKVKLIEIPSGGKPVVKWEKAFAYPSTESLPEFVAMPVDSYHSQQTWDSWLQSFETKQIEANVLWNKPSKYLFSDSRALDEHHIKIIDSSTRKVVGEWFDVIDYVFIHRQLYLCLRTPRAPKKRSYEDFCTPILSSVYKWRHVVFTNQSANLVKCANKTIRMMLGNTVVRAIRAYDAESAEKFRLSSDGQFLKLSQDRGIVLLIRADPPTKIASDYRSTIFSIVGDKMYAPIDRVTYPEFCESAHTIFGVRSTADGHSELVEIDRYNKIVGRWPLKKEDAGQVVAARRIAI